MDMARNHEKKSWKWSIMNFLKCGGMAAGAASSITRPDHHLPAAAPVQLAPSAAPNNDNRGHWSWLIPNMRARNSTSSFPDIINTVTTDHKERGGGEPRQHLAVCQVERDRENMILVMNRRRKSLSHLQTKLMMQLENRDMMMMLANRRRSASSQVVDQTNNINSVVSLLQVKVLESDMPGFMQVHAFRWARRTFDSLEEFSSKHMAYNMKKEFDGLYGPSWHCIVGSSFGSFVTHGTGCFLYFSMESEKLQVLLFRTKVQRIC